MPPATDIADIDATIAVWRALGLRALDIGQQLQCGRRWPWIRARMIALTTPPGRRRPDNAPLLTIVAWPSSLELRAAT